MTQIDFFVCFLVIAPLNLYRNRCWFFRVHKYLIFQAFIPSQVLENKIYKINFNIILLKYSVYPHSEKIYSPLKKPIPHLHFTQQIENLYFIHKVLWKLQVECCVRGRYYKLLVLAILFKEVVCTRGDVNRVWIYSWESPKKGTFYYLETGTVMYFFIRSQVNCSFHLSSHHQSYILKYTKTIVDGWKPYFFSLHCAE